MPEKQSIIFIDDEANVVQGLKRLMHKHRTKYDMEFETSGELVLEKFIEKKYDYIVSDLRMPRLSGMKLLDCVKKISPQTVRFALSGQAEDEDELYQSSSIHIFFQKPCDIEQLTETIDNINEAKSILDNKPIEIHINNTDSLPYSSGSSSKIIEEIRDPNSTNKSIAKLIERDLSISSKIMHLSNSSFYGVRSSSGSLDEAINFLGLKTVEGIVQTVQILNQILLPKSLSEQINKLFSRNLQVIDVAQKLIIKHLKSSINLDTLFTSCMFKSIGKLILFSCIENNICKPPSDGETDVNLLNMSHEKEKEYFGASNDQIAQYILSLWGFNQETVNAIRYQFAPWSENCIDRVTVSDIIYLSSKVVENTSIDDPEIQSNLNYFENKSFPLDIIFGENNQQKGAA